MPLLILNLTRAKMNRRGTLACRSGQPFHLRFINGACKWAAGCSCTSQIAPTALLKVRHRYRASSQSAFWCPEGCFWLQDHLQNRAALCCANAFSSPPPARIGHCIDAVNGSEQAAVDPSVAPTMPNLGAKTCLSYFFFGLCAFNVSFAMYVAPVLALLYLPCMGEACRANVKAGRSLQTEFLIGSMFTGICEILFCIFAIGVLLLGLGLLGHAVLVSVAQSGGARMAYRHTFDLEDCVPVLLHMVLSVLVLGFAAMSVIGLKGQHACLIGICYAWLGPAWSGAMADGGLLLCWLFGMAELFFSECVNYSLFLNEIRSAWKRQYQVYPVDEQGNIVWVRVEVLP